MVLFHDLPTDSVDHWVNVRAVYCDDMNFDVACSTNESVCCGLCVWERGRERENFI